MPVGGVLAVVEQILHKTARDITLGIGAQYQLEISRLGFDLVAIPIPAPHALTVDVKMGALILRILDEELS